jgi:hypothetical protein
MSHDLDDQLFSVLVKALKDSGKITDPNELSKTLGQTIPEIIPKCAEILLKKLKSRSSKMLKERRLYYRQLEKHVFKNWKRPIDLLEMFLVVSLETGDELNKEYRDEANKTNDYIFDVLRRLHARACLTASEILTLLKSGFADGAHARWRTLHEIAVISFFIREHGQNVAKRFLDHEIVESYRQAQDYQKNCRELGYKPITKEELQELEREHDAVLNTYGKDFDDRLWGWIPTNILRKSKRSFKEIENSVKLDWQRPYYNMACYNVHSGPKGTRFRLGLVQNDSKKELLLTGPSLFGLADAGQGAAISLYQVTVNLLSIKTTMKRLIIIKTMEKLLGEICSAFYEVHSKLKGEGWAYN